MDTSPSEGVPKKAEDDTQSISSSSESINHRLTPGGVARDDDESREQSSGAKRPVHRRVHKLSTGPESPKAANKPAFVKQFSVQSHKHSFMVTDYGPSSADKSLESVFSGCHRPAVDERSEEESTTESGVQVTQSTSCVLNMSPAEEASGEAVDGGRRDDEEVGRSRHPTAFSISGTIPSLVSKPKNKRQLIAFEIARRGRLFAKRKKDRLVEKNGECRIVYTRVSDRGYRLLHDFFTTMLELKWRYHLLLFAVTFAVSWLSFGLIWWALVVYDENLRLDGSRSAVNGSADAEPCVVGVRDYATALLFSIETQQTIGYGTRAVTSACPLAIFVVMLQSMFGVIVQCILTGIIFAKLARPKRRAQTVIFSERAVVCERDGQRVLMFRVGDIRRSHILATSVHVLLTERRTTKEGECLPIAARELKVTTDSGGEFFFLAWPIEVLHKIDGDSPLWQLSEADLIQQDWEFVVVLEGVAEVTGASFQVRTSYLPGEVLWGHRLKSLLNKSSGGVLQIDYTDFHETEPIRMTDQSAKKMAETRHQHKHFDRRKDNNEEDGHKQEVTRISFKS